MLGLDHAFEADKVAQCNMTAIAGFDKNVTVILRPLSKITLCLHIDTVISPKNINIIHIDISECGLDGRINIGDVNAIRFDFWVVDFDAVLWGIGT